MIGGLTCQIDGQEATLIEEDHSINPGSNAQIKYLPLGGIESHWFPTWGTIGIVPNERVPICRYDPSSVVHQWQGYEAP